MKNIFKIVKKEFDKIFKFPRMLFTTLIMPGLIIFLVYAAIGTSMDSMVAKAEEEKSIVYIINAPDSLDFINELNDDLMVDLRYTNIEGLEELKEQVLDGFVGAILVYDEDFDNMIANDPLPVIEVIYESSAPDSYIAMGRAMAIIYAHQAILYEELGINPYIFATKEIKVDEEKGGAFILAMILPLLLMSFVLSSALGIGTDAVAGEKERGTLPTLLMLPIKRNEIIFGKLFSTSFLTILSAMSSFIGIAASLPFAKSAFAVEGTLGYGFTELSSIVLLLLLIALISSSLFLIISTIAKNIKEATTMSMPIYIVTLMIPIFSMFSTGTTSSTTSYFIPMYNIIVVLKEILSYKFSLINLLYVTGSSLVYVAIFILILTRLFKSERILYSK